MSVMKQLRGATGIIEVLVDEPVSHNGIALVAHPHPLLGGTANHKVPFTLARALNRAGVLTWRPNFRGVGRSEGEHDYGTLETEDMLKLAIQLREEHPASPLFLVGFSFGAYVTSKLAFKLDEMGEACRDVILCGLPHGKVEGGREYESPHLGKACVIHGEKDMNVPLQQAFDWAAPNDLPVFVVPDTDHFFSGKLGTLTGLVTDRITLQLLQD